MENLFKDRKNAVIGSLFAMLLWGSAVPMIKSTYKILEISSNDVGSKIYVAGIRFLLAGVITYIYYLMFNKEKVDFKEIDYSFIIKLSITQTSLQYVFYYIGLSNTLGVKASIIQASNAFMVVLLSSIMLSNETITNKKIISLTLGTIGILIVNMGQKADISFNLYGDGFIFIATFFNAISTILLRKYGNDQNSFIVSSFQFLLGSIPLIVLGYFNQKSILYFNLNAILLLLYGGFLSATAFTIWTLILKFQSSGEFGIYKLFIPIFGSILSVLVLGEKFTINLLIGLILVLSGSVILNIKS